jgi:hypothetical protein
MESTKDETKAQTASEAGDKKLYLDDVTGDMVSKK